MSQRLYILSALVFGIAGGWLSHRLVGPKPPHGGPHGEGPPPLSEFVSELGVTEDQKAKIRAIEEESRPKIELLSESLRVARTTFENATIKTRDRAELEASFRAMTAGKSAIEGEHFEMMMRVHAVLTDEQLRRLHEMKPGPRGEREPRRRK